MSMNIKERRLLKNKIAPVAKKVSMYENMTKDPDKRPEAEVKISEIMDSLTIMEMMAVEDYIMSKGLLKNNFGSNNK